MSEQTRLPSDAIDLTLHKGRLPFPRWMAVAVCGMSLLVVFFHLYTGWFSLLQPYIQRLFSLSIITILGILVNPLGRRSWKERLNIFFIVDALFIAVIVFTTGYVVMNFHDIAYVRMASSTPFEVVLGTLYILIILEITRRTLGLPMVLIAVFFLAQNLVAEQMPSIFYGPSVPWKVVMEVTFLADNGIFGVPMMVMASYLVIYLFLVALLSRSGAMKVFIDFSLALTGRFRGGPAKVAVIGSAMLGTISGSPTANVVGTGTFTIPMMKKIGYPAYFAGAVETVSSTGGPLTPPVLGIAAFLIAEYLNVSYWTVALAAVIPCITYYTCNFATVHFEALRLGLSGMPKDEIPSLKRTIIDGWPIAIPLFVLTAMLAAQMSVGLSAMYAIVSFMIVSFAIKKYRWTPVKLLAAFEDAGKMSVTVGLACATAGIIIGSFYVSGLGPRLSLAIEQAAAGHLWIALVLTAFVSLILGMALPTVPVYVTLLMIVIPALIKMGVYPLAAHFFAFYYATLSNVTPPVAIPAYAAAAIAQASPMRVGWTACRIASPLFILPFFIPYYPAMVFQGEWYDISMVAVTATMGCIAIAAGFEGYSFWGKLNILQRIMLGAGGVLMIVPRLDLSLAGLAIVAGAVSLQKYLPSAKKQKAA